MVVWRLKPGRLSALVVLLAVSIASLFASIILSSTYPSAAFYLLPIRAWEMLFGGLLFLISMRLPNFGAATKYLALLGFTLIAFSIAFISPSTVWPGWYALVPVLGTSFVIAAANQASPLVNLKALQWIGDRSYSLYLWHWPIAAALVYLELRQDIGATIAGLLITLMLGHVSYREIELKSKNILEVGSAKKTYLIIVAAIALILAPSQLVKIYDGVPSRPVAINSSRIFQDSSLRNPRLRECFVNASKNKIINSQCTYGGNELGAIVIGDSHAASIVRAVERSLPSKNLNVLDWELHSCATILGLKLVADPKNTCSEFLDLAVEKQKSLPANVPIIIVNRWSTYLFGPNEPDRQAEVSIPTFYIDKPYPPKAPELLAQMREGLISTACEFAKTRPVYLVRPFPELKISVPKTMARRAFIPGSNRRVFISMEEYMQRNQFVWEAQDAASKKCGARILNPLPYLCSDGKCYGDHNGTPIYVDDDHLNEHGGDALIPMFSDAFHSQDSQQMGTSHHVNAAAQ
ncbi:hypothetical protein PspTeo4_01232 [Pseudomonas sp. Teo4]|nr:hypothetical protein [Pseudomonas sp. Teo4]